MRQKIQTLMREVLVHSIIYYELHSNVWSDAHWDSKSRELERYIFKFRYDAQQCKLFYIYDGWGSDTGCELYSKLKDKDKARYLKSAHDLIKKHEADWANGYDD